MLVPLSVARPPPSSKEALGFASPPRSGFAFIAAPERQRLREQSYQLVGFQPIGHVAIFLDVSRQGCDRTPFSIPLTTRVFVWILERIAVSLVCEPS